MNKNMLLKKAMVAMQGVLAKEADKKALNLLLENSYGHTNIMTKDGAFLYCSGTYLKTSAIDGREYLFKDFNDTVDELFNKITAAILDGSFFWEHKNSACIEELKNLQELRPSYAFDCLKLMAEEAEKHKIFTWSTPDNFVFISHENFVHAFPCSCGIPSKIYRGSQVLDYNLSEKLLDIVCEFVNKLDNKS